MCELAKRGHPYGDSRQSNPLRIVCRVPCRSRLTFGRRLHRKPVQLGEKPTSAPRGVTFQSGHIAWPILWPGKVQRYIVLLVLLSDTFQ